MKHEPGVPSPAKGQDVPGTTLLEAVQAALGTLREDFDPAFVEAWVAQILGLRGRVVLSGMGKSGLVAQKIAATLASTGTPSLFLHPAEALHGDLGMVTGDDGVLLLSNSGETEEILHLLPSLLRLGVPLGAITSRKDSTLGRSVAWCFTYRLPAGEGCPLDLAPMTSTTCQMVWGDLLASHLMVRRGFTPEHFAAFHPAGALGVKFLRTRDLMHRDWPRVTPETGLLGLLEAMSEGKLGMATVEGPDGVTGVVSDGDIRRGIQRLRSTNGNPLALTAADIMSTRPAVVEAESWAVEAAGMMEARKITFLVVREGERPVGILHIHDLLQAKVL
ncbi:MAG: KpsF/GutQ family sugar-phosphate isomerase [Acidobacteria bacterium]|nr:KpsF/GutQ family sugar-phosphate isomerase [Acidobacteriota bacterium]